jgi:hypothetical protein
MHPAPQMNNTDIDNIYSRFSSYPKRTTTVRRGVGNGVAPNGVGKGAKSILDQGIELFQSNVGPDRKLQNQLFTPVVVSTNGKLFEIRPANQVRVSMGKGGMNKMKGKFAVKVCRDVFLVQRVAAVPPSLPLPA